MTDVDLNNFGVLIAYLTPGLVALLGMAPYSATLRSWLGIQTTVAPTIGGVLYVTLAALALGMTVSVIRWLVLDWLHHHTGIRPPEWDFSALQDNLDAFLALVENHYRYYQFYGLCGDPHKPYYAHLRIMRRWWPRGIAGRQK